MAQMVLNNFTRGQLDHDLNGRFDLSFYFNGFERAKNFISSYKGNIKFRPGMQHEAQTLNNSEAVLMEFRFNTEQSYLLEFTENKLRFFTYDSEGNFGYVYNVQTLEQPTFTSNSQDGYECLSNKISDPYTIFNGQGGSGYVNDNFSGLTIGLKYPQATVIRQYSLTNTSSAANYVFHPTAWVLQGSNDNTHWVDLDTRNNQSFGQGETKTYNVNNSGFFQYYQIYFTELNADMIFSLVKIYFDVAQNEINPIELDTGITLQQAKKLHSTQNADAMYLTMDEINPKILKRVGANAFTIENAAPEGIDFEETGYPACCTFYSSRLWFGGFSKKPLMICASEAAEYDNFVVPESNIQDEDPLQLTLTEITDPIEWLLGGKNNLYVGNAEGITLVNGGGYDVPITAVDVNADLANKEGAYRTLPTQKDSQVFYISNDQRRIYMFDYDLLTEKFLSTDLNWLAQEVTRGRLEEIYYKKDDNNIIYGLTESGQLLGLLYNSKESIMGWFPLETNGTITSICTVTRPDGKDDLFACVNRGNKWYIERFAQEVEFTNFYDTLYFEEDESKQIYNRLIAEELKKCNYLDNSSIINNLQEVTITYNGVDTITSAAPVFTEQHLNHYIVYQTQTGKEYGYFLIKEIVSQTEVKVELVSEGCYPDTWGRFYISFNTIGGLDDFNGQTIPVVTDGGYLEEFTVTDGMMTLPREATSVVVGLGYQGLLKTFNLGIYANGKNYQTTRKRISEFVLRFSYSAGGKIGTDIYSLQDIQYFSIAGFLDLPPLPMDGDEKRTIPDTASEKKEIFVVQDMPLPLNLTMIQYNIQLS